MKPLEERLYKNALIEEKLGKLNKEERQRIIIKLLMSRSEQELADEIGIPKSTIHDWKTGRQTNVGTNIHVSLTVILRKLQGLTPEKIEDWGRIEQIKGRCEELLRER